MIAFLKNDSNYNFIALDIHAQFKKNRYNFIVMILRYKNQDLIFAEVKLIFSNETYSDVFADKKNKTLLETISSGKYKKFKSEVINKYSIFLQWPLGEFLIKLKNEHDNFYLNFLNKYGHKTYCHFEIREEFYLNKKGLYIYFINNNLKYIGRCLDSFKKRINYGYGKIHPKNCYIDGQATNCHLNYLITQIKDSIKFAVLIIINDNEIKTAEKELIAFFRPEWNLQI